MSEPADAEAPDLTALARRYVDLWQDQMAALAGDPELADQVRRLIATLAAAAAGSWGGALRRAAGEDETDGAGDGLGRNRAAARPAAAAATSRPGDGDLAELARRIADLEGRIERLEAAAAPARRRASGKPRKR